MGPESALSVQNTAQRVGEGGVVVGYRKFGVCEGPIHTAHIVSKYVSLITVKLDQQ